jgi:precorrin-2 methylase
MKICGTFYLKSGAVVKDYFPVTRHTNKTELKGVFEKIEEMMKKAFTDGTNGGQVTIGHTMVRISDCSAYSIKQV